MDVWNPDPHKSYTLTDAAVVLEILERLGLASLVTSLGESASAKTLFAFDNHPTHWIVLRGSQGTGNPAGNMLIFEAIPKRAKNRWEVLDTFEGGALETEVRRSFRFSQLPALS